LLLLEGFIDGGPGGGNQWFIFSRHSGFLGRKFKTLNF
jgi:hypothetical protein